jgi:transcriptional regulator with XRE-family HTH domain
MAKQAEVFVEASIDEYEERIATKAKPYHYVGSGLDNVYLVGVKYRYWPQTDMQAAEIPRVPMLLDALGKAVLEKRGLLIGDELRYLRKELRLPSKDFAALVGVTPEQYSRLENGATVTPTMDRLVRLLYVALAKLPAGAAEEVARTTWIAERDPAQRIVASWDEQHHWMVKTMAA